MASTPDFTDEFVSFTLRRPAEYGRENFAGDPLVEEYISWVTKVLSHDVRVYVSWQCPPDVSILDVPAGSVLLRSERLDTLLVEYHRLVQGLDLFGDDLAQRVASSQILRWMCEFLIGYRNSPLAVEALMLRPELPGLHFSVWNPFRDETLESLLPADRTALQCFSLGHEIGHLHQGRGDDNTLLTIVDGLPVMNHLNYEFRDSMTSEELSRFHDYLTQNIDADQLVSEIRADLFGLQTVAEFLHRALDCEPEESVLLGLSAVEALAFVYHCKETCRLLNELAVGKLTDAEYEARTFAHSFEWYARAKAALRRAGFTLAELEGRRPGDLQRNVARVDEYAFQGSRSRQNLAAALDNCAEMLRTKALAIQRAPRYKEDPTSWRLGPDLRLELYYILIAFGCPGSVVVEDYLTSASRAVQHVPATEVSQ